MKIIRHGRIVLIKFPDNSHCSKVYNDVKLEVALEKAKAMEQEILDRQLIGKPFTLEELISKDKKRYKVLHKFHIVQPRFQDKRAVEKLISKKTQTYARREYIDYKNRPLDNRRSSELLIPFTLDNRTTIFVRESKIFDSKYLQKLSGKFEGTEGIQKYVDAYKQLLIERINNENELKQCQSL